MAHASGDRDTPFALHDVANQTQPGAPGSKSWCPQASRVGTRCTPFCRRCGGSGNRAFRPHRSRRHGARVRGEPAMRSSPSSCGTALWVAVDFGTNRGMSFRAVIPGRVGVWCCGRWGPRHIRTTEVAAVAKAEDVYDSLPRHRPGKMCVGADGEVGWWVVGRRLKLRWVRYMNRILARRPRVSALSGL